MEDGVWLKPEDKKKLDDLLKEFEELKAAHLKFSKPQGPLSAEDKQKWKLNSQRTAQVSLEIKDLRHKNILEGAKG
jgi:hypothetical protein